MLQVFNLHGHQEVESDHAHEEEEENMTTYGRRVIMGVSVYTLFSCKIELQDDALH